MLKKLVRSIIFELWPELTKLLVGDVLVQLMSNIQGVFKLEPNAQYIIVVKDDHLGEELVQAMNDRFDPSTRVVVLAAEDVKVLEIMRRR